MNNLILSKLREPLQIDMREILPHFIGGFNSIIFLIALPELKFLGWDSIIRVNAPVINSLLSYAFICFFFCHTLCSTSDYCHLYRSVF